MAETSPSGRRARPRFSLHTLQAKVVALVAAAFLVTLGAATAYTVRSQRAAILATATEQAQALAKMCFDSLNVMMLTDNMESREIVTRRLAQDPKVVEARVIRGEPVTAEYDEGLDGERPVDDLDHRALAGEGVARVETVDGRRVFTFIRPLAASESRYDVNCLMCHHVEEGTVLGAVRIRYSLGEADAAFAAFLTRTLAINLGLFGLGLAAVAWWVRRGAVLPLRRMAATAREIAAGRIDGVVDHRSGDEIGALAEAFREMVAYLRTMADGAERLARGDAEGEVVCQGDHDRLGCAFRRLREVLHDLLAEGDRLLAAARSGDLHRRAEAGRFPGAFGELLEGINRAMDAMAAPVDETLPALERLAAGDLSARVTGDYAGEYGQLKEAFNGAAEGLARVVRQVNERSEAVARAAAEIAEENRDLAGRLEQEAASLEETAAAVEEITATVEQNADHAGKTRKLAEEAAGAADAGAIVVCEAVGAVGEIETASNRIRDIIEVIDEIAFQTNLLSLNAAVEAARAGEHGRGFAVVAAEVRNLARRSAKAAEEIQGLISESVAKVNTGNELVMETGEQLAAIRGSVREVTETVVQIAGATEEQAAGIGSVNEAVQRLNGITHANAAAVEQVARRAAQMRELSERMRTELGTLKV